jgi:hypothetical protein
MSWHHVGDLDTLLDALAAVAPGGRLFVADLDADGGAYHGGQGEVSVPHGFDRAGLCARMASHDYADITVRDLWQGTRWVDDREVPASVFFLQAQFPGQEH